MQTDLEIIIKDRSLTLSAADVKSYIQMVLQGLDFCHKHWVLHRDIKPNNFLISANGGVTPTAAHSNSDHIASFPLPLLIKLYASLLQPYSSQSALYRNMSQHEGHLQCVVSCIAHS